MSGLRWKHHSHSGHFPSGHRYPWPVRPCLWFPRVFAWISLSWGSLRVREHAFRVARIMLSGHEGRGDYSARGDPCDPFRPRRVCACPPHAGTGAPEAATGPCALARGWMQRTRRRWPVTPARRPSYRGTPHRPARRASQPPTRAQNPATSPLCPSLGATAPPVPPDGSASHRKFVPSDIALATRSPVKTGHVETGASTIRHGSFDTEKCGSGRRRSFFQRLLMPVMQVGADGGRY